MANTSTFLVNPKTKTISARREGFPIGQHVWEREHLKLESTAHRKYRTRRNARNRMARASRRTNRRGK